MLSLRSAETLEWIIREDPAIDHDNPATDWKRYEQTGDRAALVFHDGAQPTVFRLRRLPAATFAACLGIDGVHARAVELVAYSLVGVDNFLVRGGRPPDLSKPLKTARGPRLRPEVIDDIYAADMFGELALRICVLNTLDPTTGRG